MKTTLIKKGKKKWVVGFNYNNQYFELNVVRKKKEAKWFQSMLNICFDKFKADSK